MVNDMKIWINKCLENEKAGSFSDAIVFNISVPGKDGRIASNIREGWYQSLGTRMVSSICEDLYIIALAVFAVDKRVPRANVPDGWTRTLHLNIPVIEVERWRAVKPELEHMLTFLSGDIWTVDFRRAGDVRYRSIRKREPIRPACIESLESVALFSGGLDSFCGAYEFLSQGRNTAFVGFKEYGKLEYVQKDLMRGLDVSFPTVNKLLFTFTAKAYAPIGVEDPSAENTSRSRSFLFLCAAVCVADIIEKNIPVYIPENGFIGLNLPLTPSRSGSCSTRTTHPYFLKMFNNIISNIGILHDVSNPYAFMTKREMVQQFKDFPGFIDSISKTISCSHPCNGRWRGESQPENCGYCYPCLIRQSSLIDVDLPLEHYTYDSLSYNYIQSTTNAKCSDLVDLLSSVSVAIKSSDEELIKRIKKTGQLTTDEILAFLRLYKETIRDLIQLFSRDPELLRIMGIANATN